MNKIPANYKSLIWLSGILLLTTLVYFPLYNNDFLKTWDDNRYILENPHIKNVSADNIKNLFTIYYDGHYHPLTLLSLAFDFQVDELNPRVFHFTNLLLHLINTLLVFWFVLLLIKPKTSFVPLITSVLFGISTMHTESVAWATERKNLLFTLFFLLSIISYIRYLDYKKVVFYFLAIGFFIFSLLSKVSAITLCVTLVAVDWYYKRGLFNKKVLFEKIPFFLLALGFGFLAIAAQKSSWGEDLSQLHYPFYERIIYASYAFIIYIAKLIIPLNLSGLYPYPENFASSIAFIGFIGVVFIGLLVFLIIKKIKNREVIFGILFFAINISFLLKLFEVPAGDYILADRYAYVPSMGIFLVLGIFLNHLLEKGNIYKKAVPVILVIYILFLSLLTMNRVPVWKNDLVFYTDMIAKTPNAKVAYTNRGGIFREKGKLNEALNDFNRAINLGPAIYKDYSNRGVIYNDLGMHWEAAKDLKKALNLGGMNPEIMSSYAYACLHSGNLSEAIDHYNKVIQLQPGNVEAYSNRGTALFNSGNLNAAITDYSKAVSLNPGYRNAWFNRGLAKINLGDLEGAKNDLSKTLELDSSYAEAWSNLAVVYSKMGVYEQAFNCYNKAIMINPSYAEAYLNRGVDYYYIEENEKALADFEKVILINPQLGAAYYFKGMILLKNNQNAACEDFNRAFQLGFGMATEMVNKYCKK